MLEKVLQNTQNRRKCINEEKLYRKKLKDPFPAAAQHEQQTIVFVLFLQKEPVRNASEGNEKGGGV